MNGTTGLVRSFSIEIYDDYSQEPIEEYLCTRNNISTVNGALVDFVIDGINYTNPSQSSISNYINNISYKVLSEKQKDILATYQAGKAYLTKQKICLFDCEVVKDDLVYPSKKDLENKIKTYLSGTIALEVIKNETYVVSKEELQEAYKIANDMVEEYKMEDNESHIIKKIKSNLKEEFEENIDQIEEIKKVLLKDEVVVF